MKMINSTEHNPLTCGSGSLSLMSNEHSFKETEKPVQPLAGTKSVPTFRSSRDTCTAYFRETQFLFDIWSRIIYSCSHSNQITNYFLNLTVIALKRTLGSLTMYNIVLFYLNCVLQKIKNFSLCYISILLKHIPESVTIQISVFSANPVLKRSLLCHHAFPNS